MKYLPVKDAMAAAKAAGSTRYHGNPCPKGHGTLRLVSNHVCVVCGRERVKHKHRRFYLKRAYGITVEDYDRMFKAQRGRCAICRRPERAGVRLAVDHNHKTEKVRGLLCHHCNKALGTFERFAAAFNQYLENNRG